MTLDEAIEHAEEVADKKESEKQKWDKWLEHDNDHRAIAEKESCQKCAEEHRQLAEWLKELKAYREREPSYEAGYNDAKREIALSGEYKRAYDRGYEQAVLDAMKKRDEELSSICPKDIRKLSPVTPQPKIGHWIIIDKELQRYKCSECGEIIRIYDYNNETLQDNYKFSHCGAKMEV